MKKISNSQKQSILSTLNAYGFSDLQDPLSRIVITDFDTKQIQIKIKDGVYLYSERVEIPGEKPYFRSDVLDIKDFDEKAQREAVSGYNDSLEEVKEIYGDDWQMIVLECAFEQEAF